MEGLSGIDHWDQCYDPDDDSPKYRYGREQLTAETNAAIAGAFDAGASEVRVLDGHGRNQNKGFILEQFDPRARRVWISARDPLRWEGVDENVTALAIIGQHAMAGTINGFIDHAGWPRAICRFLINGEEHGEIGEFSLYAGAFGIPLAYVSGDEACCEEVRRLYPWAGTTPTKRGTGWATCELYPADEVRRNIRRDIAKALRNVDKTKAWRPKTPIQLTYEYECSEHCDAPAKVPGVERPHARVVCWWIDDARDVYGSPVGGTWKPANPPQHAKGKP